MKSSILVLAFLLAMLPPVSGFTAQEVGNLYHISIPTHADGSGLTEAQIREAIFAGCRVKGWRPSALDESRIKADIDVRSHWAQVTISYSSKEFAIEYRNSRNLDYNSKKNTIHRNYNKWVILLSRAIEAEMSGILNQY